MKKLLTLMTLLLLVCSGAWAASVTYNFTSASAFTDDKIDLNDYVFLSKRTSQSTVLYNNMFSIASTDDYLCVNVKSGYKITSIVYTCYSGSGEVGTGKKCYGSASTTYLSSSNKASSFTLTHTLSFGNTQKVSSGGKLIGDVTLNASTVHNCVSVALGKKIGSTSENNVNFTIGKVTVNYETADMVCATPTITVDNKFNFANKGYKVTITNNEGGSTLYYSTNNADWTEYTSALYATTTTHYYAKSVKASYDDSEVADKNVTNTFDSEKKYIAWVYKSGYTSASVAYNFETDPMVIGLKTTYNVVPVALADGDRPYTNRATDGWAIDKSDLVVCTEAVTGNTDLANDMENFVGRNAMINLKLWNYGGSQTRWGWGTPANNTSSFTFTPTSTLYKVLNGVTFEDGAVKVFESTAPKDNKLAYVTWTNEPTNNVNMGSVSGKTTMHAIIDDANLKKQFFAFGLSRDNATSYTANAVTIIKNAAAMLIAGTERLDAEVATVPVTIGVSGYASYCSSYALDFTETGVTAYTAKVEGEKVVLTKVTDNIVPANEGVVLRGAQNDYNIPVANTDDSFDFSENQMVGVVQRTQVVWNPSTDVYNYILQQGQFNMANGGYLKANRAYLSTTYNVEAQGGAKPLTIVFNDEEQGEETDGIKSVQGSRFTVNGEAYNLAGQKVGADYKGIVIVNGKKVIRK